MVKALCAADCGNAPKKAFLRDFNVAFAENDVANILAIIEHKV